MPTTRMCRQRWLLVRSVGQPCRAETLAKHLGDSTRELKAFTKTVRAAFCLSGRCRSRLALLPTG